MEPSSLGENKISNIHNENQVFGLKKKNSEDDDLPIRSKDAVAE